MQATGRPATQGELDPPPLVPRRHRRLSWHARTSLQAQSQQRRVPVPRLGGMAYRPAAASSSTTKYCTQQQQASKYVVLRCAPPSLDPGSVFGAPREIWNIGEASPALVQNHGTLQRTAGQFPVPPSHAKLRVPIFLFTTARHVHCPSSSLHSSLTLFACLPSPNARYSTHHIGLSIAPQTCRPSFRTLQSFSAFFIISSANSLVASEPQQLKITINIRPAGFFTLEYRQDTRRERQKSGDIQISTCIPHGVVPPCADTKSRINYTLA